ncbi:hypothetical protein AArcSl_2480 [Halalkaliarchaeum desulfuricum]|uniref:Uncharacterized protein n=1 Tax=Halalkaliarchaeum desulfuricum TaxID=2055893 RepID=A0A343TLX9_9EURY|nr:hypothetical protein AArcSl_2480 [Halalkaliarchaeum desulfuricum]
MPTDPSKATFTRSLLSSGTVSADKMPQVHLDEETIERLDSLRQEDEEYDEIINELINIYEVEELTLYRSGGE